MLIIRLSYCNRLRLRKKTQSTTIVQKKCTYPQVENITILPEHLFSLKKTTSRLLKRQRLCSIRVSHFPRRVSMIIFFQSKSFMRRRVRRYRLRHKIHAIKTRPNNPLRFLQHKNSTSLFVKRFNLCCSQSDVQNTKAFSQQTIHAQIKRSTV